MNYVEYLIKKVLYDLQEFFKLCYEALRKVVSPPVYYYDAIEQLDVIGVGSLKIVLLTGLFTGMVLALQTAQTLATFGAKNYVGKIVSASIVRELGPVLCCLMLAGRVSSGIAAELGAMVVTDQINAMRAMGSDPVRKLVVPRMISGLIAAPTLTVLADFVGLLGGWIISIFLLHVSSTLYWRSSLDVLAYSDILSGVIKPICFGFVVVMVGCYYGLNTSGGTRGVGMATTNAVVTSSILILALDFFLTKLFFAIFASY
jgi:phospholipid/cholesterol/gamma-HCH transport system permease protein